MPITPSNKIRLQIVTLIATVMIAPIGMAIDVSLDAGDGFGTSSFNTNLNWDNNQAPSASNDYFTSSFLLRTPDSSADFTFAGNSLTVQTGGSLGFKGSASSAITVNDLKLDGGRIINISGSGLDRPFDLSGGLEVLGGGGSIEANNFTTNVLSTVTGSGDLNVLGNNGRSVTFSANNTFTGDITLGQTPGSPVGTVSMSLTSSGGFSFDIGASGVNNGISGTGGVTPAAVFDGAFTFDLSGASTVGGSSWTIVDTGTVNETYDSNFIVTGFTENNGVWTSGVYQFEEATGLLTVVPEPGTYAFVLLAGLGGVLVLRRRRKSSL